MLKMEKIMIQQNHPDLWIKEFPHRKPDSHKYDYGHALIYAAPELTGATRLAAEACARMGAGLVTVLAPEKVADVYRVSLPAHILVRDDLKWKDARVTAKLYGSGGLSVKPDFKSRVSMVLDADALYKSPKKLRGNIVLTPHEGEFARAFPTLRGTKPERAQVAARQSGAIIVLKGSETVIAAPDGRTVVNVNAPPFLATAGTGDVLAGMITGLLAQGVDPFTASCIAVWVHGECAGYFGPGLVASDLIHTIPAVTRTL
jgi:NAD(P)H-hydrate repair Nnr-like enzyme with NAD(P)H-hydrate dehydratase domain